MKNMFKNPWSKGGELYPYEVLDASNVLKKDNAILDTMSLTNSISPESIYSAAIQLGSNELIINSFKNFQDGRYKWFFSKNNNLVGKRSNDFVLKTWKGWDSLDSQKRVVLLNIAELPENPERTTENLEKLIESSYKWKKNLYAIFWGSENAGAWTCNIFVGEAIYWAGKDTSINGKYMTASSIHKNQSPFKKVQIKDIVRGNIVTFNDGHHTEIITKISLKHFIADDGFCSIGAGRSDSDNIGEVICDGALTSSESREVNNKKNGYHKV